MAQELMHIKAHISTPTQIKGLRVGATIGSLCKSLKCWQATRVGEASTMQQKYL